MQSASFTIKLFGVYVILTGLSLTLTPNLLLAVFGIPPTNEFWIRQLGILAIIVGYYYWACGAANATAFFKASIPGRIGFFALGVGLVVLGQAPWQILLFGVVDLLGAGWTAMALKSEQTA